MFSGVLDALDRPLRPKMVVVGCLALIIVYAALMIGAAFAIKDGLMPTGDPAGQDFSNFYAAGELIAQGRPADVYPLPTFQAQLEKDHPGIRATYVWNYPVPASLFVVALPSLPYLTAMIGWTALSLAGLALAASILARHRLAWLVALAAPAAFWDAWHHQVGCLSAILLALGFYHGARNRLSGGALIGMMIIKPHLAVAAPFVFLAGRRWAAIGAAGVVSLGLCLVSYLVFGPEPWRAFFHYAPRGREMLEGSGQLQSLMPSVFVATRMLGAPLTLAYGLHITGAVIAVTMAVLVWIKSTDPRVRTAAALCACGLISPYTFAYDSTLTGLAVAALVGVDEQRPLPRGSTGILTLVWFWPLPAAAVAFLSQLQLGWAAPAALLAVTVAHALGLDARNPDHLSSASEAPYAA